MKVKCPYTNCKYETEECSDATLLNTLMKLHASSHPTPAYSASISRMENLQRPTISLARNSEEWWYFTIRWGEYRDGCRLDGQDVVIQLLECCTEELRKDLVRTAGRSLAKKSEKEVLQEHDCTCNIAQHASATE